MENGITRTMILAGPGNPRNSEGAFIQLNDGRILLVYTHYIDGTGQDHDPAYLAGRVSTDLGRTWEDHDMLILPNEGHQNVMSVTLLRLPGGEIALFYHVDPDVFALDDSLRQCLFEAHSRPGAADSDIIEIPFDRFPTHLIGEFEPLYDQIQIDVAKPLIIVFVLADNGFAELLKGLPEIVEPIFEPLLFARAIQDLARRHDPVSESLLRKGDVLDVYFEQRGKLLNLLFYQMVLPEFLVVVTDIDVAGWNSLPIRPGTVQIDPLRLRMPQYGSSDLVQQFFIMHIFWGSGLAF